MRQASEAAGATDNVHQIWEADLAQAKGHADAAQAAGRKSIEAWARCADSILAAIERALPRKLTHAEIGRALGWKVRQRNHKRGQWDVCPRVGILLSWRAAHPHVDETTPMPFGGQDRLERDEASTARRVTKAKPDVIVAEALKHPDVARRIIRDLQEGLADDEPAEPEPPRADRRAKPAGPKMSTQEAMDYVNDLMRKADEERAKEDAEDRKREERAERRENAKASRERAKFESSPRGIVIGAHTRLWWHGPKAVRSLHLITSDVIARLTPEERESMLPELVECLEQIQAPVEAALAVCRTASNPQGKD